MDGCRQLTRHDTPSGSSSHPARLPTDHVHGCLARRAASGTRAGRQRYRLAMSSGQTLVVDPDMRKALAIALCNAGCPPETARQLSLEARVERPPSSNDWLLMLKNHGTGYPANRDEVAHAVDHLAMNLAADNAEAVDRAARSESGWTPYWPTPDRAPRRR